MTILDVGLLQSVCCDYFGCRIAAIYLWLVHYVILSKPYHTVCHILSTWLIHTAYRKLGTVCVACGLSSAAEIEWRLKPAAGYRGHDSSAGDLFSTFELLFVFAHTRTRLMALPSYCIYSTSGISEKISPSWPINSAHYWMPLWIRLITTSAYCRSTNHSVLYCSLVSWRNKQNGQEHAKSQQTKSDSDCPSQACFDSTVSICLSAILVSTRFVLFSFCWVFAANVPPH